MSETATLYLGNIAIPKLKSEVRTVRDLVYERFVGTFHSKS